MTSDNISLKCSKCGSSSFKLPTDPKPDDMIVCAGCGATARYKDVQAQALDQASKFVEDLARDIFKSK